ncbi:hypothetical protein PYCCODRAFT_1379577 [Trametes coccinea BRFM310]|uniref:Uncharacterized protein n=1 Tax=Trametes coccinea (strain BRFM310) TaxID=1353009 RepID=A0A1Y2I4Z7_TRAC3|nr:hypothetical protein PYCCODRAFT_1379577 [Trametes coccinea BRFM310]
MISIEDAVAAVQEKEAAIRTACFDYDNALHHMRQTLRVPDSQELWLSAFTARIKFLNKEYRRQTKNDLQALCMRMRQQYGEKDELGSVMTRFKSKVEAATDMYVESQRLIEELQDSYERGVREQVLTIPVRVLLRRAIPRLRRELTICEHDRAVVASATSDWMPYLRLLISESEMSLFLQTMRLQKLSTDTIEGKAAPVFDCIIKVCKDRDEILLESSRLGLLYESHWQSYGRIAIPHREYLRKIGKFDDLIRRAESQRAAQAINLQDALDLLQIAMTPTSVVLPGGEELQVDKFTEAYGVFVNAHAVCASMTDVSGLFESIHYSSHHVDRL